jgi:hypothetical protein
VILELANIFAAGTAPAQGYKGLGFSIPDKTLHPAGQRFLLQVIQIKLKRIQTAGSN